MYTGIVRHINSQQEEEHLVALQRHLAAQVPAPTPRRLPSLVAMAQAEATQHATLPEYTSTAKLANAILASWR